MKYVAVVVVVACVAQYSSLAREDSLSLGLAFLALFLVLFVARSFTRSLASLHRAWRTDRKSRERILSGALTELYIAQLHPLRVQVRSKSWPRPKTKSSFV